MKKNLFFIPIIFCLITQVAQAQNDCRRQPAFIQKFGFDPARSAVSTAERTYMGVCLIELADAQNQNGKRNKIFQHPSWRKAGYMASVAITEQGDVYVIPAPTVNILYNKPDEQNWVYKIDHQTGEMNRFVELPAAAKPSVQNAYGTLGSFYDCDTHTLFVTSVMGSTQNDEKGRIFAINLLTNKVTIVAQNTDAMGICVVKTNGKRQLFFGKTRTSDMYSLTLDANNLPLSDPTFAFTLDNLAPRGDDRARRIRFTNNNLQINAASFYYNLTAPTEKPETIYVFSYDTNQQKWILVRYE